MTDADKIEILRELCEELIKKVGTDLLFLKALHEDAGLGLKRHQIRLLIEDSESIQRLVNSQYTPEVINA